MLFEMEFLLSRGYVLEKYRKSHNCMLIIVGHSYGTMLGSKYTLTHPDKVAAYIGVGQFVDIESDIYSYEDALDKAKAKGDDTTTLEEAYRKYSQDMTLTNMIITLLVFAEPVLSRKKSPLAVIAHGKEPMITRSIGII